MMTTVSDEAKHEASHVVPLFLLGHPDVVQAVSLAPREGAAASTTLRDDLSEHQVRAVIVSLLTPLDPEGGVTDRATAVALARRITASEPSARGLMRRSRERASELRKDPRFKAGVESLAQVADAHVWLSGFEIRSVMEGTFVARWSWEGVEPGYVDTILR